MTLDRIPNWVRWLILLPAAALSMALTHFILTAMFTGTGNHVSFLGVDLEGETAVWINRLYREGLMRFFEPFAFVAVGTVVAPKWQRNVGFLLGIPLVFLHLLAPATYVVRGASSARIGVSLLQGLIGVAGVVVAIVTMRRNEASVTPGLGNRGSQSGRFAGPPPA